MRDYFPETEEDLKHEAFAAGKLAEAWNLKAVKLAKNFPADYAFMDNAEDNIQVFAEIKYCNRAFDKFPTMIFEVMKYYNLKRLMDAARRPVYLVGAFPGEIYSLPVEKIDLSKRKIKISGRTDRGGALDIQPCFHVPTASFTTIWKA